MTQPTSNASFHHLHLRASHPADAARWYAKHLGLRARESGGFPIVEFPGEAREGFFVWYPQDSAATAGGAEIPGTVGSTLDHFGWSVSDVEATHRRLIRAGCQSLQEPLEVGPHALWISFLLDPYGTKIELLADTALSGWHHVHLLVPDALEHRAWWQRHFGGESLQFNDLLPGLRQQGPSQRPWWILFRETDDALLPTAGRSIDHFAYEVADVDAALLALESAGVPITSAPRDAGSLRVGFIEAPGGLRVELVARARS